MFFTIAIVFILSLSILAAHSYYHYTQYKPFTCRTLTVQQNNDTMLKLSILFMFKKDYGIATINGQSTDTEGRSLKISRDIYFNFKQDGEFYPLTSRKIIKFPDDNVSNIWLSKYLPDFYVQNNQDLYFIISRQKNDNSLFFLNSMPLFTCKNIDNNDK